MLIHKKMSSFTYFTMDTGFCTLDRGKKAVTFLSFYYLFITLMQYESCGEVFTPRTSCKIYENTFKSPKCVKDVQRAGLMTPSMTPLV